MVATEEGGREAVVGEAVAEAGGGRAEVKGAVTAVEKVEGRVAAKEGA